MSETNPFDAPELDQADEDEEIGTWKTVSRVDAISAAKVLGTLNGSMGLIIGVLMGLIQVLSGNAMGVVMMVGAPLFYGLAGLIGGAIAAGLYNLVAGAVGGIEIELS